MNNTVVRASIIHWMSSEIEVEQAMAIATIAMAESWESLLKEKLTAAWEHPAPIILEKMNKPKPETLAKFGDWLEPV